MESVFRKTKYLMAGENGKVGANWPQILAIFIGEYCENSIDGTKLLFSLILEFVRAQKDAKKCNIATNFLFSNF